MNLLERFMALPVWARYLIVAVAAYLVLKGYGYIAPIVTQPGLN